FGISPLAALSWLLRTGTVRGPPSAGPRTVPGSQHVCMFQRSKITPHIAEMLAACSAVSEYHRSRRCRGCCEPGRFAVRTKRTTSRPLLAHFDLAFAVSAQQLHIRVHHQFGQFHEAGLRTPAQLPLSLAV